VGDAGGQPRQFVHGRVVIDPGKGENACVGDLGVARPQRGDRLQRGLDERTEGPDDVRVEYETSPASFCGKAKKLKFNSLKKPSDYSLYDKPYKPCR
jgi:hypothetical protein